ncbi:MAG: glycosyltransferase family 2 protein [Gammaproteobacteria bacterium]
MFETINRGKVSVVIPTFNRIGLVNRAIHSVLRQTRSPDEIIVVDDGSCDGTNSSITEQFPEVIVLFQQNRGVSSARNLGISKSRCEWIAFLDSDDEWLPRKLEAQLEALAQHPEYRICHSDEIWIRNGIRVNPMKKHRKKGGWIFQHCLPLCAISPSSALVHRSLFAVLGGFDESLPACEDYDMWLRITSRYPVLYIDKPLLIKTGGHADQLSRRYWGMDRFRIQALEKIILHGDLQPADRRAACAMLARKAEIFCQGAKRRERSEDLLKYESLRVRYAPDP